MAEKQVLFRVEEELLHKLDRKLAQHGFKTRNAWFKAVAQEYVSSGSHRPPQG